VSAPIGSGANAADWRPAGASRLISTSNGLALFFFDGILGFPGYSISGNTSRGILRISTLPAGSVDPESAVDSRIWNSLH
jgi:hypothetical protein